MKEKIIFYALTLIITLQVWMVTQIYQIKSDARVLGFRVNRLDTKQKKMESDVNGYMVQKAYERIKRWVLEEKREGNGN